MSSEPDRLDESQVELLRWRDGRAPGERVLSPASRWEAFTGAELATLLAALSSNARPRAISEVALLGEVQIEIERREAT